MKRRVKKYNKAGRSNKITVRDPKTGKRVVRVR
jgi:hypothetical protein